MATAAPLAGIAVADGPNEPFESLEVAFESSEPEEPDDVRVEWELSEGTAAERVQIEIDNENDSPINIFKPNDTSVSNPFDVSENESTGPDIVVEDLDDVSLRLKIPPGHCDRVESVTVSAYDDEGALVEPTVRKEQRCEPTGDRFEVTIDEYDGSVHVGETVTGVYTVENVGDEAGTQDIVFAVDDETEQRHEGITLEPGANATFEHEYETGEDDPPEVEIEVRSDDDADTRTVTIGAEPEFQVNVTETNAPIDVGDTLAVTAEITNEGDRPDEQEVTLVVGGETRDRGNVTLGGNESATAEFEWETGEDDSGAYTATVRSDDDADSEPVEVHATDRPFFAVEIEGTNEPIWEGDDLNVTATVDNVGDETAEQEIRLTVDGNATDAEPVELDSGGTDEVELVWSVEGVDPGEYDVAVESDDDSANHTATVSEPAFFAVEIEASPTAVNASETVDVVAGVENVGDRTGIRNVTLYDFDGDPVYVNESLELAPGESSNVTLSWSPERSDTGTDNLTVRSEDDADAANLTVEAVALESISVTLSKTELESGERAFVVVEAEFADESTQNVTEKATIESLDPTVATVTGATVQAESDGTATIEATFEDETDTVALTVETSDSSSGSSSSGSSGTDDSVSDDADDSGDGSDADDDRSDESDDSNGGDADDVGGSDRVDTDDSDGPDDPKATSGEKSESDEESIVIFPGLGFLLFVPLLAKRGWSIDA